MDYKKVCPLNGQDMTKNLNKYVIIIKGENYGIY